MKPIFITNLAPGALGEGREQIVFQHGAEDGIPDLHRIQHFDWSQEKYSDAVFVIDVHFRYRRPGSVTKLQEQGGVDVYRYLLAHFAGRDTQARVVFYSPIGPTELVRMKPENYVLSYLPFAEGAFSEDFVARLVRMIAQLDRPCFNNASENLLSGWALDNKERIRAGDVPERIDTEGRRILVVDDEMPQWDTVLKTIIGEEFLVPLAYDKSSPPDGVFSVDKLGDGAEMKFRNADLILSDLYLEERHETTRWMSGEQLQDISGFKLFGVVKGTEDVRGWDPGIPYLMHTSSNKVSYFRLFQTHGLDGWFVKDLRANAPANEKQALYELFATGLSDTLTGDRGALYTRLTAIWQAILQLEAQENGMWWHAYSSEPGMVINILKAVWLGIRAFIGRGVGQYDRLGAYDEQVIVPSAYISLLGQLSEVIRVDDNYQNFVFKALKSIRHCGAHHRKGSEVLSEDVVIFLELWLLVLSATDINNSLLRRHRDRTTGNEENPRFVNVLSNDPGGVGCPPPVTYLTNQLLCTYLQLYNYDHGEGLDPLRPVMAQRIEDLFRRADKASLLNDIIAHEVLFVVVRGQNVLLKKLGETIGYGLTMDKLQRKGVKLVEKYGKLKVVHG